MELLLGLILGMAFCLLIEIWTDYTTHKQEVIRVELEPMSTASFQAEEPPPQQPLAKRSRRATGPLLQ